MRGTNDLIYFSAEDEGGNITPPPHRFMSLSKNFDHLTVEGKTRFGLHKKLSHGFKNSLKVSQYYQVTAIFTEVTCINFMPHATVPITTRSLPRARTKLPTELIAATRKMFAVCKRNNRTVSSKTSNGISRIIKY